MNGKVLKGYEVGRLDIEKFGYDHKIINALLDAVSKINKRHKSAILMGYIRALEEYIKNITLVNQK